jgi:TIR domain
MRRKTKSDNYLFAEQATMHDVVERQRQSAQQALNEFPGDIILRRPLEELIAEIVERYRLDVPILDRTGIVQLPNEEAEIDVSRDPMRLVRDRSRPFYVKGTALRIAVPFKGEAALFKYRASPYNSPIQGEIKEDRVVLTYIAENPDPEAVRKDFEHRLGLIESALQMVRGRAEEWNRQLPAIARDRLEQRRSKLERDQGLSLGYPAAPPKEAPVTKPQPKVRNASRGRGVKREYDLFLSHASEDKDAIARPLYESLIAEGISVWFDEAVLELGDSLRRKIDEGLAKCRYGLVILSPMFLSKEWPQRELDGLVARETASGEKAILPIWHEIDRETLLRYSPPLADRLAGRSEDGIPALVEKIRRVLKK